MMMGILKIVIMLSFLKLVLGQETTKSDPCQLIRPYCRCIFSSARIVCDEFNSFEQLDFSPFSPTTIVDELELNPRVPLMLNDSLKIVNIAVRQTLHLININGIELFSNPFKNAIRQFNAELKMDLSTVRTFQSSCDTSLLTDDYVSLFSLFDTVRFSYGNSYGTLCPLIFHNADISKLSITRMDGDNRLKFDQLASADDDNFDLNSKVHSLTIRFSTQLVIDEQTIDKRAFNRLTAIDLVSCDLSLLDERTFYHTQDLNSIGLGLTNMKTFIQSSNNTWMTNLNRNVRVNYSDPESVEGNLPNALLVTFDTRDSNVNYTYPDEDLVYFSNFPHERFVFANILAKEELDCTETIRWLVQNAEYYEPIMTLNTTNCFTSTTVSSVKSTTTIRDRCELIKPYCRCNSSLEIICDGFDSFSQIDFSPFGYPDNQTTYYLTNLHLYPRIPITIDDSLRISNVAFRRVYLTNINGIQLFSNPFKKAVWLGAELYMENSTIRTFQITCNRSLIHDIDVSLFSSFAYIRFGNGNSYKGGLCPLIFRNAFINELNVTSTNDDYLNFVELLPNSGYPVNSHINWLVLKFSNRIVIDERMIDGDVFDQLKRFRLLSDDINEQVRMGELAFYEAPYLTKIEIELKDLGRFLRSSNNTWMTHLNRYTRVNYSNPQSILQNRNYALLVSFDTRNSSVSYTYPDEDLMHFAHFQHDRFVFAYILGNEVLQCSQTLRFLLKNAQYFPIMYPIISLNTTATSNCFSETQTSTSVTNTTTTQSTTTTQPMTQTATQSTIQLSSQSTSEPTIQSTIDSTTQTTSASTWQLWTSGFNNTESKQVLLGVYLSTVIPIGVVCFVAIIGLVVFFYLFLSTRSKLKLSIKSNNSHNIDLNPVKTSF